MELKSFNEQKLQSLSIGAELFLTIARVFLIAVRRIWAKTGRNPCILAPVRILFAAVQKHGADSAESQKTLQKKGEKGLLKLKDEIYNKIQG